MGYGRCVTVLTVRQQEQLIKPINPKRVHQDAKGFSHLEAWDVRAHMNRVFGFCGWSANVTAMELVCEGLEKGKDNRERWEVTYRACCTISVNGASYTEWAGGDAVNPRRGEAHDQAMKTAESQAFKRCAVNLGDQFGLSLYNNGGTSAVVGRTLTAPSAEVASDDDTALMVAEIMGMPKRDKMAALLAAKKAGPPLTERLVNVDGVMVRFGKVVDDMLDEMLSPTSGG